MQQKTATGVSLLFLGVLSASATEALEAFVTANPPSTIEGMTPQVREESFYIETWNFIAELENGASIRGRYILKRLGNPSVEATLITPDGEIWNENEDYPWEKVTLEEGQPAFQIGNHRWEGNEKEQLLRLHFAELSAKLTFKNRIEPWTYRDGIVRFDPEGKKFMKFYFYNPLAEVEGEITYKGQTLQAHGLGYGDHTIQNLAPNFARQWYNFHFMKRGFAAHATLFQPRKKGDPLTGVIAIFEGSKPVFQTRDVHVEHSDLQEDPHWKRRYPMKWTYIGKNEAMTAKIEIEQSRLQNRLDPAAKAPLVVKPILKWLQLRPAIYHFSDRYRIELSNGKVFQGKGIHEWIQMGGDG